MIHAVSYKVHKRILQAVHNGLVNLGVLALDNEINLFAQLFPHIADNSVHFLEHTGKRYHSYGHNRILKLTGELSQLSCRLVEAFQLQTVQIRVGYDHGFGGDDLSDYIMQRVQFRQIYADEALLLRSA